MKNIKAPLLLILAICISSASALAEPHMEKALDAINEAIRHVEAARQ